MSTEQYLDELHQSYQDKNLTLYLGAGVSMGNGLPSWDQLVLAMYFSIISEQSMRGWRPFPNYLFAISQWFLGRLKEPLEITGRKLQRYFDDTPEGEKEFVRTLYETLYSGHFEEDGGIPNLDPRELRDVNPTLDAVAQLCENTTTEKGLQGVVTYNYDDFLEIAVENTPHQSVSSTPQLEERKLPIYHVHGFVPLRNPDEMPDANDIVFTEYQYNKVAREPNHWSNQVQLETMSNSVGLMIGLSLSDRNMRRLLDTLKADSKHPQNYALLKRPQEEILDEDLDDIHEKAIEFLEKFENDDLEEHDFSMGIMTMKQKRGQTREPKRKSAQSVGGLVDPITSNAMPEQIQFQSNVDLSDEMALTESPVEEMEYEEEAVQEAPQVEGPPPMSQAVQPPSPPTEAPHQAPLSEGPPPEAVQQAPLTEGPPPPRREMGIKMSGPVEGPPEEAPSAETPPTEEVPPPPRPMARKGGAPMARKMGMKKKKSVKVVSGEEEEAEPRYRYEIRKIIREVERLDREQQEFVMKQLGIKPIWYSDYSEIPGILKRIIGE